MEELIQDYVIHAFTRLIVIKYSAKSVWGIYYQRFCSDNDIIDIFHILASY